MANRPSSSQSIPATNNSHSFLRGKVDRKWGARGRPALEGEEPTSSSFNCGSSGVSLLGGYTRKGVRHPERHGFVVWWDMDPVQFGFLVDFGFVEGGLCPGLGDVQLGVIELSVNLERASRFAIGMEVCESIPVNGESVG